MKAAEFIRPLSRQSLISFLALLLTGWSAGAAPSATNTSPRLNILFFSGDDMNYDSSGVYGGTIKDLKPNLDHFAAEGFRFEFAYSTVAVCQPVRQTMQTGLYTRTAAARWASFP